jgi:hypothetical protein
MPGLEPGISFRQEETRGSGPRVTKMGDGLDPRISRRRYEAISSCRSHHSGFSRSMSATFHLRGQCFMFFSR